MTLKNNNYMLLRFWFTFILQKQSFAYLRLGCGVTAYDYADAISLMKKSIFTEGDMLEIASVVENVAIDSLDKGHVIPNMGVVVVRGIWFPMGY